MGLFYYLDKFLDDLSEIHSILEVDIELGIFNPANLLTNQKFETKYTPIYLNSNYTTSGIKHNDAIFKHSSGFYIYLSRQGGDLSGSFKLIIIYKTEQYEEIKLYINNLKKTIQNGDK